MKRIYIILVFSILHFGCNTNKCLKIVNSNDLFDSLLLNISINGLEVFNKRIPLSIVTPEYINKPIGRYSDSVLIDVNLPEIGVRKSISAASNDFKYIYISLTKVPDIEKIDSNSRKLQGILNKEDYFKSNISVLLTKKKISPLL